MQPVLFCRRGIVTRAEETRVPVTYETAPSLKYGTVQVKNKAFVYKLENLLELHIKLRLNLTFE